MYDEDNLVFIGKEKVIQLTLKENIILSLLIKNKGKIIKLEEICKLIYKDIDFYSKNCARNKIYKLRKKLQGEVDIVTVKGIGYKIPLNINLNYCPFCGKAIKNI